MISETTILYFFKSLFVHPLTLEEAIWNYSVKINVPGIWSLPYAWQYKYGCVQFVDIYHFLKNDMFRQMI